MSETNHVPAARRGGTLSMVDAGDVDHFGRTALPVSTCRVCGSDEWTDVVSFGAMPLANAFLDSLASTAGEARYPLGVISCSTCRLMSLTHVVDPGLLYRNYMYLMSNSPGMRRHMAYVARSCRERFGLRDGDLVVELGSNTGAQLAYFRSSGMRVVGIDPAENLAEAARRDGIETVSSFFSPSVAQDVLSRHGPARLVLGRHVFGHIDDLTTTLAAVGDLLDDDGVLAIEVPYLLDLVDKAAFDTIYHEHLSYFGVGTFDHLFRANGFRLVDAQRVSVHGGSILVFATRSRRWRRSPAVERLLTLERNMKLHEGETYEALARRISTTCRNLVSMVQDLSDAGNVIAGYGAPAKGTTLLNICGIGPEDVAFCADTTELKQGKLVPGVHIPVYPPAYAREHPPDYYILLAWNHANDIMLHEADYLARGGRFIIPIPEPRIVMGHTQVHDAWARRIAT